VVHWVSPITPNFQGSAHVNETPINIVNTKANANTVLKQNSFFIVYPPFEILETLVLRFILPAS
jgi:hypothetical protein